MCGRYAITLPPQAVREFFKYTELPNFPPRFNIAPTQPVPVVLAKRVAESGTERHFMLMRWGFLPGFVKDVKAFPLIINARSETVLEKPSFRNAFRRRRCIFIMDGYYEWCSLGPKLPKQPYLLRRPDLAPFGVGGLWETYVSNDGSEIDTACMLTTEASGAAAAVHHRMPVILSPNDFACWLDLDETKYADAAALLRPAADDYLEALAVSNAINKAGHEGAQLQTPVLSA